MSRSLVHDLRSAMSGWYSGDVYQALSASMLGNSMIRTRSGSQWPPSGRSVTFAFSQVPATMFCDHRSHGSSIPVEFFCVNNFVFNDEISRHRSSPCEARPQLHRFSNRGTTGFSLVSQFEMRSTSALIQSRLCKKPKITKTHMPNASFRQEPDTGCWNSSRKVVAYLARSHTKPNRTGTISQASIFESDGQMPG